MPDLSEAGCCNSRELIKIAKRSYECQLNRLVPQSVLDRLDENGLSIFNVAIPFHNGELAEHPHHRCNALLKLEDTNEPYRLFMDIHADDWDNICRRSYDLTSSQERLQILFNADDWDNIRSAFEVDPIKERLAAKEKGENNE